jgi:hypothetical protein
MGRVPSAGDARGPVVETGSAHTALTIVSHALGASEKEAVQPPSLDRVPSSGTGAR